MLLQVLLEAFITDVIIYFIAMKRISSLYQEGQINIFHKGSGGYDCRQDLNGRKLVMVTFNLYYVSKCWTQRPQITDSVARQVLCTAHGSLACSPLVSSSFPLSRPPVNQCPVCVTTKYVLDTFPYLCGSYLVQGENLLHDCILNSPSPACVLAFNSLTSPNQFVTLH